MIEYFDDYIYLKHLPIPISSNNYIGKRYSTKEKKEFIRQFASWQMMVGKRERAKALRFVFGDRLTGFQKRIRVGIVKIEYFWVTDFKTVDGRMKMFDASNRMKLTEDCLAKFLTIDDCYFKEFSWETTHHHTEKSFCVAIHRAKGII